MDKDNAGMSVPIAYFYIERYWFEFWGGIPNTGVWVAQLSLFT